MNFEIVGSTDLISEPSINFSQTIPPSFYSSYSMDVATLQKPPPVTFALNVEKKPSIEPVPPSHPTTTRKLGKQSCRP
jgi:hypothetical protein